MMHKTYFKQHPVRLKGKAMEQLRRDLFKRADSRCEHIIETLNGNEPCGKWLPWDGDVFTRGHMSHIKGHGAGGGDTLDNVVLKCYEHHIESGDHGVKWSFRGYSKPRRKN